MSSSHSDSTKAPIIGKEKVDKTFLDTNFFSDAKIQFLIAEFGAAGPTYYLRVALAILSEGGAVHTAIANSFVKQLGASEADVARFFDACLAVGLFYSDGSTLRSARADKEVKELHEKRLRWRQRQEKWRERYGSNASVTRDTRVTLGDSEKEKEYEKEQEKEPLEKTVRPKKPAPEKHEYQPFVHLTEAEAAKVVEQFGQPFFDRCCQKLSAWIESDPTPKRKRNGTNAAATFRSWVFNAVSDEEARAARSIPKVGSAPKNAIQANLDVIQRLKEEEVDCESF